MPEDMGLRMDNLATTWVLHGWYGRFAPVRVLVYPARIHLAMQHHYNHEQVAWTMQKPGCCAERQISLPCKRLAADQALQVHPDKGHERVTHLICHTVSVQDGPRGPGIT